MIETVLVPMDDLPLARRALNFALEVHPEAEITILHVIDYVEESYGAETLVGPKKLRNRATERAEQLLDEARQRANDHAGEITTATTSGNPSRVIPEYAESHDFDITVIGGHGRSLVSRVLLGDVAQTVVKRAAMPVTVVR